MTKMPEERTEKRKVKLQRIRSSEVESQKMTLSRVGVDTAIRSSRVEKAKMKAKEEAKSRK